MLFVEQFGHASSEVLRMLYYQKCWFLLILAYLISEDGFWIYRMIFEFGGQCLLFEDIFCSTCSSDAYMVAGTSAPAILVYLYLGDARFVLLPIIHMMIGIYKSYGLQGAGFVSDIKC